MNRTVAALVSVALVSIFLTSPNHAAEPWETLASSPGAIDKVAISPSGEVCILEQLRFTRIPPDATPATVRDLPQEERIFLSPSGLVQASIVFEGIKDVANAALLTVSRAGQTLWTLDHQALNDIVPLESGGAVAASRNINLPQNSVYFYSSDGKRLKQIELPALGEIKSSLSGDRVLINSGIEGALLYDASGNQIARLGTCYRMFFSDDGHWAAVLYASNVNLFLDGRPAYKGELGGEIVRGMAFSPDNALFAAFTDHALFLLKNPDGEVLMQQQLDVLGEWSFTSVDLTKIASCIAVGVERDLGPDVKGPDRHPEGEIRLYNLDGSICYQKGVTYSHWNTTTPRVQFSADDRQLIVLTRDEILRAPVALLCGKGGVK